MQVFIGLLVIVLVSSICQSLNSKIYFPCVGAGRLIHCCVDLVGGSCPISTRRRWKWNRISVPHLVVNVRWIHVPVDQFAATDGAFNRYQRPLASGHWISVSSRRRRGSGFLISWHRLWFLLIPYWLMIPWISYEESSNAVHTSNTVMLKSQL